MEKNRHIVQWILIILTFLGLLTSAIGGFFFFQYIFTDKQSWLINASRCILWGFWPAFMSLLLAIRRKRELSNRFLLLAITPTAELLVLGLAIFFRRWL